ncbi:MAG: hypothetical protein QM757_16215 [Paludibaculum sp.]
MVVAIDGHRNLFGGIDRGPFRVDVAFVLDVAVDIFQHDDGVINDNAYRER